MPARSARPESASALNGTAKLDNVKVPRGATCTLNGRVKGNIKVGEDATLIRRT